MNEKRYTVRELSERTNMSKGFWRKQINLGNIEAEYFGRSVRVTEAALNDYLERQQQKRAA